jgi:hypothetical protein
MMKQIAHGGRVGGMGAGLEHMSCRNLLENSS